MKAFAQGAEATGATHMLIYDHVMGADPNRPGGWKNRPYDKDVAFPEPFTTFAFIAAVTSKIDMMSAVLILPQRQTVLVGKQAAEVAILSNGRFRLGVGTGWNTVEYEALNEDFHTRGARQSGVSQRASRINCSSPGHEAAGPRAGCSAGGARCAAE